MTAKPERLFALSMEAETNWAENVDTWGTRYELIGLPTLSLNQERIAEPITQQYREEGKAGVLGPKGGTMSVTYALTGHGTATTGALTETDLCTILGRFLGSTNVADTGDTVATGTSATQFAATSETYSDGGMLRIGALGDGRCDGQWAAVNVGATTTLLTALPGTPNAADQVYSAMVAYPDETVAGDTVTSMRALVQTANKQYKLRGVFPTSGSIQGNNTGEIPTLTIEYSISWFDEVSETFPDVTNTDAKDSSIAHNGSVFVNDVGTATRAAYSVRQWSMDLDFQVTPLPGPDAINPYQTIVGAVRNRCAATLSIMFDAESTGNNTWSDKYDAGTLQHILIGMSVAAGKAVAIYFPNCEIVSHPMQEGSDGINRITVNFRALTGPDTATALDMSSFRIGMA